MNAKTTLLLSRADVEQSDPGRLDHADREWARASAHEPCGGPRVRVEAAIRHRIIIARPGTGRILRR